MTPILAPLLRAQEKAQRARELLMRINQIAIEGDASWDDGDGLLNFDGKGAGTRELSTNMSGLSHLLNDNPDLMSPPYKITPEISDYLQGIADARGITVQEAENDYRRFLDLMNESGLEISTAGNYGSQSQLRFGYVVGDALGIDPAFASMMSPTGGLTGPGGKALDIDGDGLFEELGSYYSGVGNEALSYHAPTHDAYGFLNKHFETGPGYCYVPNGGDCFLGNENPLSGQLSGINFWEDKLDLNPIDAVVDAGGEIGREAAEGGREVYGEVREAGREIGHEGREAGREISNELSEAGSEISEEASEAGREILEKAYEGDAVGVASEMVEGSAEVLWQTGEGGAEILWETGEGGMEVLWETGEGTVETLWETGEGAFEAGREFAEGGVEILNEVEDTLRGGGVPFVPGI